LLKFVFFWRETDETDVAYRTGGSIDCWMRGPKTGCYNRGDLTRILKKVAERLSPDEKKQFAADLMLVALSSLNIGKTSLVGAQQDNNLSLDGKTAAESEHDGDKHSC